MFSALTPYADLILSIACGALVFTVLPTLYVQWKAKVTTIPLTTSLLMLVALLMIAVADISLSLPFAAITVMLQAMMWGALAWQRVAYGPEREAAMDFGEPLRGAPGSSWGDFVEKDERGGGGRVMACAEDIEARARGVVGVDLSLLALSDTAEKTAERIQQALREGAPVEPTFVRVPRGESDESLRRA